MCEETFTGERRGLCTIFFLLWTSLFLTDFSKFEFGPGPLHSATDWLINTKPTHPFFEPVSYSVVKIFTLTSYSFYVFYDMKLYSLGPFYCPWSFHPSFDIKIHLKIQSKIVALIRNCCRYPDCEKFKTCLFVCLGVISLSSPGLPGKQEWR